MGEGLALVDERRWGESHELELGSSELQLRVGTTRCCMVFALAGWQLTHLCINNSLLA